MSKDWLVKNNLSNLQKISLAGLFIALDVILQKVVAINYLPFAPFLRISVGGPALIIFGSFLLGPIYGLFIGAASDLVGYFIFDPKTMGFFPQITAIYALLGFSAYFVFMLIRLIKSKKLMAIIEYCSFALLYAASVTFIWLKDEITLYTSTYTIVLWQKITVTCVLFVLLAILVVCLYFTNKFFKKREDPRIIMNPYQVSFACFILEIFVMIMFGTLMKGFAFGFQTYLVILITQIMVGFINVPLNTFLISYLMYLTKRFY